MKDLTEAGSVSKITRKEPDPAVVQLRQDVNEVLIEAGLLEQKNFQGTDYLAISDELKERNIDMAITTSPNDVRPVKLSIALRTHGSADYEEMSQRLSDAMEGTGLDNVSWHYQRPLVVSRAKQAIAAASAKTEAAAPETVEAPSQTQATTPELD